QPVFEAIAESAARLTSAFFGATFLVADNMLHLAAMHIPDVRPLDTFTRSYPIVLDDNTLATRVAREGVVVNFSDTETEPSLPHAHRARIRMLGARSMLIVPMVRASATVGMIMAGRQEPGAFTEKQVALLQTFADQAVIAIENVRLFTELDARNRDLTGALERQTATSEILGVISSSPTGVQATFDTIARSAALLCEADLSGVYRFDGELIHFAAQHGRTREEIDAVREAFPQRPGHASATARAILAGAVVQISDASSDSELPGPLRMFRSVLSVPMLRDGRALGTITVAR